MKIFKTFAVALAIFGSFNAFAVVFEGQSHLDFDLAPALKLSVEIENKIVNLKEATITDTLTFDSFGSGFRSVQSKHIDGGLGIATAWHFVDGGLAASLSGVAAGIIPVQGSTVIADRFVQNREDISKLPAIKVPYLASDLAPWRTADSMSFQTSGGVLFFAGASYVTAAVGAEYLAQGDWITYVEKMDNNYVYVKISNSKLRELSQVFGTALFGVKTSQIPVSDYKAFSYIINLSDPNEAQGYEDLIRGNITAFQSNVSFARVEGVRLNEEITSHTRGRITHRWFGIPLILDTSINSGKVYNFTDTIQHLNGTETKTDTGVYFREKTNRILFHRNGRRSRAFYGVSSITGERSEQNGKIVWEFSNAHSDSKNISKEIAELIKQTGLRQEFSVKVPKADNLGYAAINATMTIPQGATDFMLNLANNTNDVANFKNVAVGLAKNYFSIEGDPDTLCSNQRPEYVQDCQDNIIGDTQNAVKTMLKFLKKMNENKGVNSPEYVKAYAEFGKAMMKNQFSLRAVFAVTQNTPIQISYKIEGERIATLRKEFR